MSEKESDEDYQARMDRLAIKIGRALDGQSFLDSATVQPVWRLSPLSARRLPLPSASGCWSRSSSSAPTDRKNPEDFSEH